MYLKYLTIKDKDSFVIQHVDFKKGVNIIKGDEDELDSNTNSLGKTTLLRCIDFCLGGKIDQIIQDKESKKISEKIFNFFKKSEPTFELLIVDNLNSPLKLLKIEKKLILHKNKKGESFKVNIFINNKKVSGKDSDEKIKLFLFNYDGSKPTLRQLIPKFIRTSDHQISNIIKYLHPTTSNVDYEYIHLFLFDFSDISLINNRSFKEKEISTEQQYLKQLERLLSKAKREINDVKKIELDELKKKHEGFKISEEYDVENDKLYLFKEGIEIVKNEINNFSLNRDVLVKRINELKGSFQNIDTEAISYLYKEAEIYNVELHKKFEETIVFHNEMLSQEIKYLENSLDNCNHELEILNNKYSYLANSYSEVLNQLATQGSLSEYTELGNKINILTQEISETESLINQQNEMRVNLERYKIQLDEMTFEIRKSLSLMRVKLAIFNRYFSEYSNVISNDNYFLTIFEDKNKHFILLPNSIGDDQNVGDGKKQSLIIVFDLAYTSFIDDPSIKLIRPHFFSQDKVEIIDVMILNKLIKLIKGSECQFIFPLIKDKMLNLEINDSEDIILTLTKDKKFFDIENYDIRKEIYNRSLIYN